MPLKVSSAELVSESRNEELNKTKEFVRDKCFSKWDTPFGLPQEIANPSFFAWPHLWALSIFFCDLSTVTLGAVIFAFVYGYLGVMGTTAGCHRYWTHKSFKATLPLQIILMAMQTIAIQYPIFKWCLDHRIHHKYTDTNADPYNSRRGFWFSHVLWLFLPKEKECAEKLKTYDMSDLEADPVVRFQSEHYYPLCFFFNFVVPMSILHYGFGVGWYVSMALNCWRYIFSLHSVLALNSVAHRWGDKPYDKNMSATETYLVSFFTAGDGFHNFHHTFPSDYRTSEYGWKLNASAIFIDFFAKVGWAYDLKTVSDETIRKRMMRTGTIKSSDEVTNGLEKIQELLHPDFSSKSSGLNESTLGNELLKML